MSARGQLPITHEQLQRQVVDLAHYTGWYHLHVRRTIGRGKRWVTGTNVKGWPDLFLWSPKGVRAIEVKIPPDKLTPEQHEVLKSLGRAGVPTLVVTPDNFHELTTFLAD